MTLQQAIFSRTEFTTKRAFAKAIKRSEPYVANMLNSDLSVRVELGVGMMIMLGFSKDDIKEIVLDYLVEEFTL